MLLIETLISKKEKFYLLRVVRLKLFNIRTNVFFFRFHWSPFGFAILAEQYIGTPFIRPCVFGPLVTVWTGFQCTVLPEWQNQMEISENEKKNWSLCWKALNGPPSKDKIFSSQQGKKEKVIIYYPHSGGEDLPTEAAKPQRGIENFSF